MSFLQVLEAYVRRAVRPRLDPYALYTARVVSQAADGTLDVVPDDGRLSELRAPLYLGLPGCTAQVPAGTRVLIGFAGGDRTAPFASLFSFADVTSVTLGGDAGRGVARVGDPVVSSAIPPGGLSFVCPTLGITSGKNVAPVVLTGPILTGSASLSSA